MLSLGVVGQGYERDIAQWTHRIYIHDSQCASPEIDGMISESSNLWAIAAFLGDAVLAVTAFSYPTQFRLTTSASPIQLRQQLPSSDIPRPYKMVFFIQLYVLI